MTPHQIRASTSFQSMFSCVFNPTLRRVYCSPSSRKCSTAKTAPAFHLPATRRAAEAVLCLVVMIHDNYITKNNSLWSKIDKFITSV